MLRSIQQLKEMKGLKLLYWNICSITKKIDQCRILFENSKIDVISLSEKWLQSNVPSSTVAMEGFHCFRQDRNLA